MSKIKFDEWELEHYTPLQLEIMEELCTIRISGSKLTEEMYNKLIQLETNDLDIVMTSLYDANLYQFLERYRKNHNVSLREYNHLLRFDVCEEFTYEALILKSKFSKKYGYSIRLFYLLNEKVGLSYRELERLSDIGKDTLNKYVKIYKEYTTIEKEIGEVKSTLFSLERKSWEARKKL